MSRAARVGTFRPPDEETPRLELMTLTERALGAVPPAAPAGRGNLVDGVDLRAALERPEMTHVARD
jgi:hypothetical protein